MRDERAESGRIGIDEDLNGRSRRAWWISRNSTEHNGLRIARMPLRSATPTREDRNTPLEQTSLRHLEAEMDLEDVLRGAAPSPAPRRAPPAGREAV
jgi:hypothetical protein